MKSNKQVKAMIIGIIAEKLQIPTNDLWYEDGQLMRWDPPCGYSEGDEIPYWWHWYEEPYISIKANEAK